MEVYTATGISRRRRESIGSAKQRNGKQRVTRRVQDVRSEQLIYHFNFLCSQGGRDVNYSKAHITQAVRTLSKGYDPSKPKMQSSFKEALLQIITFSCEALRFSEIKKHLVAGLFMDYYSTHPLTSRHIALTKNWGRISDSIWEDKPSVSINIDGSLVTIERKKLPEIISLINTKKRDTELLYELQRRSLDDKKENPLHGSKSLDQHHKSLSCSVFSLRKLETHYPNSHTGMCTSSVYWRSRFGRGMRAPVFSSNTFGRGMCTSVLLSHAAVRGWPTAAEETDLYPRSFLSDPTLSTLQQQTSIRGCPSIMELSDSSPRRTCTSFVFWSSNSRFSRGMCTPGFSSHTFGRGMCASSVFPSPAVMRGWPTAVGLTDLHPRAFLSGPMLSTWQRTSVRGCSSILERSCPSCKDGIYSASCQMFRIMRSVFRR